MADEEQAPGSEPVVELVSEAPPVEVASDEPKESTTNEPEPASNVPVAANPIAAAVEVDAPPALDPVTIAAELARAKAAALAAQFTAGHGGVSVDAETNKRFREFEEDENNASKRLNTDVRHDI